MIGLPPLHSLYDTLPYVCTTTSLPAHPSAGTWIEWISWLLWTLLQYTWGTDVSRTDRFRFLWVSTLYWDSWIIVLFLHMFLRDLHIVLIQVSSLALPPVAYWGSVLSPHLLLACVILCVFGKSLPSWDAEWHLTVFLIYVSLMCRNIEHFFPCHAISLKCRAHCRKMLL